MHDKPQIQSNNDDKENQLTHQIFIVPSKKISSNFKIS